VINTKQRGTHPRDQGQHSKKWLLWHPMRRAALAAGKYRLVFTALGSSDQGSACLFLRNLPSLLKSTFFRPVFRGLENRNRRLGGIIGPKSASEGKLEP